MSLRPVTLLFLVISAFWLSVAVPVQAAAETFLVVINASNRVSGSDAELREVVRQLYLKEESRWPDDLPSTPIARPVENAATAAFTETILGITPEELETYWAEAEANPPGAIGPVRDLLRQVSRHKGAFSVVASAEAEKLPAKVRVLFEFTTTAPDEKERLWSREDVLAYVKANKMNINNKLAYYTQLHKVIPKQVVWKNEAEILKFEIVEIRGDSVLADITYRYGHVQRVAERTFPFHLQWIDENLQFVGHGEAAVAALSPSTEPAPGQAGSFDGSWVLEFRQTEGATPGNTGHLDQTAVATSIVSNRLSTRFKGNAWQGEISGSINESGMLVGRGWVVGKNFPPTSFDLRSDYIDGVFQAEFQVLNQFGNEAILTIALTRANGGGVAATDQKPQPEPETAAMLPATDPTPSQTGSFDGDWVFEFRQLDGPYYIGVGAASRAVTETSIVSNEFSARFKGAYWQGQIFGSIDESGKLVANGWVVRRQYEVTRFNIKADYVDGVFQAEFDAMNIYGDRAKCLIVLTRGS